MSEATFKSTLSMEEIEQNFAEVDFFSELMGSLEEALAYSKGKATSETIIRKRTISSVNVPIRNSLNSTKKP